MAGSVLTTDPAGEGTSAAADAARGAHASRIFNQERLARAPTATRGGACSPQVSGFPSFPPRRAASGGRSQGAGSGFWRATFRTFCSFCQKSRFGMFSHRATKSQSSERTGLLCDLCASVRDNPSGSDGTDGSFERINCPPSHRPTVLPSYRLTVLPSYRLTVLPSYRPTVPLSSAPRLQRSEW